MLTSQNVNKLKKDLLDVCYGMKQTIIDNAINEWHESTSLFVVKGYLFEQML